MTEASRHWRVGMVIGGKYALINLLGQGGAGAVFEAQHTWLGRRVAIKVLHPDRARQPEVARRFMEEARAATRITHPNIVDVLDIGVDPSDGSAFIVQEYLKGKTLRRHLQIRGRLGVHEAVELVAPIMGALVALHQNGVVHRDLKPENIFLAHNTAGDVVPKLIDFGIAMSTEPSAMDASASGSRANPGNMIVGTSKYMSPEQARGESGTDARTDVWSAAVVLYELLAGRCPVDEKTDLAVLARIMSEPPLPIQVFAPDTPPRLAEILMAALEPDLRRRTRTMQDFLRALLGENPVELADRASATALLEACEADPGNAGIANHLDDDPTGEPPPASPPTRVFDDATGADVTAIAANGSGSSAVPPSAAGSGGDAVEEVEAELESDEGDPDPSGGDEVHQTSVFSERDRERALAAAYPSVAGSMDDRTSPGIELPEFREDESTLERYTREARLSLETNALESAIEYAEQAINECGLTGEALGRMRLIQAVAHRWRGEHPRAEARALEAMGVLARGSADWYTSAGELASASGTLGRHERLTELVDELAALRSEGAGVTPEHLVATFRLATFLLRAGWPELVHATLDSVRAEMDAAAKASEPSVRGWALRMQAELALHDGDPGEYLRLVDQAAAAFARARDARTACLQRVAVGNALMELGAYAEAERVLREVLTAADRMKLDFTAVVKGNLGVVLARLGDPDEALVIEAEALQECVRQGSPRGQGFSRVYLAVILHQAGDLVSAEREARAAVGLSTHAPSLRAFALATLAEVLRATGRAQEAAEVAHQAVELLEFVGGVEEGESKIRLAHAEALYASGAVEPACAAIVDARDRLMVRAARIRDEGWRQSFLENVPENARTLAAAREWLGEG